MSRLSSEPPARAAAQPGHAWATPAWHDDAMAALDALLVRQQELHERQQRVAALEAGLTRTVQRVNLFERQLIPRAEAAMRDIRLHLADLDRAAVVRAKLARARLQAARGDPA
jgi:V/A-type H+-transporting ATPase subunit D